MDDLKKITAKNITTLRTANHMTQFELGEKINYSDKAISRWERGEAVPDAYVLLQLSEIFDVTVDYLLTEHRPGEKIQHRKKPKRKFIKSDKYSYSNITLISFIGVWTLALLIFVVAASSCANAWLIFPYALPVSLIVLLVFNSIWGKPRNNFFIISGLSWSILLAIYLTRLAVFDYHWNMLFTLGIPAQIIIFLCFNIKKRPKTEEEQPADKNPL